MSRTAWRTARIVGTGYLIVAVFLVLFFLWMQKGKFFAPGLSDPKWGLLIAAILVLPVLLPGITTHILPRIHSIRVAEFLEISLREVEVAGYSAEEMTQQLQTGVPEDFTVSQTLEMMHSYSSVILDGIKKLQESRDEVLVVDLREGKAWIPPNLYFLTLMALYRTHARQIVFVETRDIPRAFIASSSLETLEQALGMRFPIFRTAAAKCGHQERALTLEPSAGVGATFFEALKTLYSGVEGAEQVRKLWLNSTRLAELTDGGILHRERICLKEKLSPEDYRLVLASSQPYVAIVKDGQLESFVSRERVALRAAHIFVDRSSI